MHRTLTAQTFGRNASCLICGLKFLTVQVPPSARLGKSSPSSGGPRSKSPSATLVESHDGRQHRPAAAPRYRFGVFEVDAATGELRRQGLRVKLNTQPFQVLLMLLDRPGQLLTREEISRELWPDGTFVDYEHGVNSAINRIREALGDTAASPRFLETLARRGYRFIAPVERVDLQKDLVAQSRRRRRPVALGLRISGTGRRGSYPPARPESRPRIQILATPEDLPKDSYRVAQTLFILFQLMYLGFYVGALANLAEIEDLFSPLPNAAVVYRVLILTAAILIPVRAFVLCAALFHAPGFREKVPEDLAGSAALR
jgi:cholera toxin transcriptional activator